MSAVDEVTRFAREVLRAEFLTPAGVVNLVWEVCVLAVVVVLGFGDLWQALVRTWNDSYTTDLPSVVVIILAWGGIMLACVLILALVGRKK